MDKTSSNKKPPLFMPKVEPYGLKYKDTDRTRAFRRQPLKNIPEYLTYKSSDTRSYLPPVMHFGWILDQDRALSFVQSHGFDPVADLGDGPVPNYYLACKKALHILLDEQRVVPHDARIKVSFFNDGQFVPNPVELGKCNFHLALSVGTNYSGTIPMEHIEKLRKAIASGSDPKWFLDMDE